MPARGHSREPLLQLVERVPQSRQAALAGDTARAATSGEVKDLRRQAQELKEVVAQQALELRLLKKHDRGWGRRGVRLADSKSSRSSARRAVASAGATHPGSARHPTIHVLSLVRPVSSRRARSARRHAVAADTHLEPHPRSGARAHRRHGAGDPGAEPARTGHALHRHGELLRLGISVYRLLKAHDLITSPAFIVIKATDEFKDKTTAPNQLWQTDFTYLKVIGWGWFYLSTILDDFSRYIIAWKLCTTMRADDVTDTLQLALTASGCASARVAHKPRLLSDNGSSYVSGNLAKWLEGAGMDHVRGAPNHPQTQGKIERWHQTLKNRILLDNYYLPGDLEAHIDRFVEHYNHQRYHESLQNLTPPELIHRLEAMVG